MAPSQLDKLLSDWQGQGFLTADQAERIRMFEAGRAPKSRLMLALTLLAVLSIGLGIISLIAANWDQIPGWLKLGSYFSLMLLQVYALVRWDRSPGIIREALYFLYMLWILAGIGLIAQVFHVPSDGWRGATLWSVLGLGLALRARQSPSILLWLSSFVWAGLGFVFQDASGQFARLQGFMALTTVLCIGASYGGRWKLPEPHRSLLLSLGSLFVLIAGPWCFLTRPTSTPGGPWELPLAGALAITWLLVLSRSLRRPQLLAALVVALAFFARWFIAESANSKFLQIGSNFLDTVAFVVQLSALGLLALHLDRGRIFDVLTLLMAARIFTLFFMLFGTLFMTGAGLILFGILVLGLLHIWYRYHDRLQTRLKGILQ